MPFEPPASEGESEYEGKCDGNKSNKVFSSLIFVSQKLGQNHTQNFSAFLRNRDMRRGECFSLQFESARKETAKKQLQHHSYVRLNFIYRINLH